MMYLRGSGLGFAGLGSTCDAGQVYATSYASCVDKCPSGQCYDINGLCVPIGDGTSCSELTQFTEAGTSTQNPGSSQQSWWQSALEALTVGAVVGAKTPTPSAAPATSSMPAVTTPWYQKPIGIIGILAVLGVGAYALAK